MSAGSETADRGEKKRPERPDWHEVTDEPVPAGTDLLANANKISEQAQALVESAPAATEQAQAPAASAPAAVLLPRSAAEEEGKEDQVSNGPDYERERSRSLSAATYPEDSWADDTHQVGIASGVYEWQQVLAWAAEVGANPRIGWADLADKPRDRPPKLLEGTGKRQLRSRLLCARAGIIPLGEAPPFVILDPGEGNHSSSGGQARTVASIVEERAAVEGARANQLPHAGSLPDTPRREGDLPTASKPAQ